MVMKTTHLIALMGLGFIVLFLGWPWWLGIGIILLAMSLAVGGEEPASRELPAIPAKAQIAAAGPAQAPQPSKQGAQEPPKPWWVREREKEPTGSFLDPLKFRPSVPPDGIGGISSIKPEPEDKVPGDPGNLTVGKRTGTMSLYMGPDIPGQARVRIKDDFRLIMPWMQVKDENGIKPLTNVITAHLRTNKPIIKTKALEHSTFEQWDKELWDGPDWDLDK